MRSSWFWRCCAVVLAAWLLIGNGSVLGQAKARAKKGTAAKKSAEWANAPDETADENGIRVLRPLENRDDKLVFAPAPSPMVAVGSVIFDLAAAKETGKINELNKGSSVKYALSPSGQYFAQTKKEKYHSYLEVVDTTTGDWLHKLEFAEGDFQDVIYMTFTADNHLEAVVPNKPSGARVLVWRMSDGKQLREIPTERLDERKIAFTSNGAYMAAATSEKLSVFNVAKGKPVADMRKPPAETGILGFIFLNALAFSPDGTELAAIMTGKNAAHHLIIWGSDGKIVEQYDLGLTIGAGYYKSNAIEWTPDGLGLLLHGNFYFDRELGAVAYVLMPPVQHDYPHRFLDDDHLVATTGDFSNRNLVTIEVPRKEIAAAVESLDSGAEALLKPGDSVKLKVEVGATKFAQGNEVLKELTDTVTARLTAGGLKVADDAKVTLTVTYSEGTGEDLRVVERDGIGFRGRETGQTVKETIGKLDAEMVSGGKSIFKTSVTRGNPHFVRADKVDDEEVRKAMFVLMSHMLKTMQIPYFVPADEKALRLPVIADLRTHRIP